MFNEERFDDLTRALATNRLSRRQVLKSFAAGVLLAGPLGSLVQKTGVAQTLGCVPTKCVKSAEKEYAHCNKGCRNATNRAECLEECQGRFAGQLVNCGCLTMNIDTASGDSTPAPCADPCTVQTLSGQANQDANYSKLVTYLSNDGFVVDSEPKALVLREDGALLRSVLGVFYSHPSRSGETAGLYYTVEGTGPVGTYANVHKDGELSYVLVIGDDG